MIKILKNLLEDLKSEKINNYIIFKDIDKKIFAVESTIEILEKLRSEKNE